MLCAALCGWLLCRHTALDRRVWDQDVLDPHGQIVFNDEIDTPKQRSLVPEAVRQRVEEMEQSLETATKRPAVEIGRLDIAPVEIR